MQFGAKASSWAGGAGRRERGVTLIQCRGGHIQRSAGVVLDVRHDDVGRIDDRHIVDAVSFHVGGDIIGSAEDRVRSPGRLPGNAKTRLEVGDPGIGVVVLSDLRLAGDEIVVDVLAGVFVAASRGELIAQTQGEGDVGGGLVGILHEGPEEAVAQVEVQGRTLLNFLRQAQQEVGERASGSAYGLLGHRIRLARVGVGGVLAGEDEPTGGAGVASVDVVHDVVVELEAGVDGVLAVGPGERIFDLDGGVVEDLDAVVASDGLIAEGHRRKNVSRNAGQTELLRQIPAGCVGVHLVVCREDLRADAEFIHQRWCDGAIVVDDEVLQRIFAGEVRSQHVGAIAAGVDGVHLGVASHDVIFGRCLPVDLHIALIGMNISRWWRSSAGLPVARREEKRRWPRPLCC